MDYDLPRPSLALVLVTQFLLGTLFLVGIGALALLPGFSASVAMSLPEYAHLQSPLLALAIAFTVLGLIALVMVALLVLRIHHGTVLTHPSLLWVDVIVVTLACAAVLTIASFVVMSNEHAGNPFIALIQATACLTLTATACITLVLRSLLRNAILIRSELDEVV
jgi:hypothetical protein